MIDISTIASIIGTVIFAFFVSREEDKPNEKKNKYYSRYGRPVLDEILKSKGIDINDSRIKSFHKNVKTIGKNKGTEIFHDKVTPEIEKLLKKGEGELKIKSSDKYHTVAAKTILKDMLNKGKLKSKSDSTEYLRKDTGPVLQVGKPKAILKTSVKKSVKKPVKKSVSRNSVSTDNMPSINSRSISVPQDSVSVEIGKKRKKTRRKQKKSKRKN